MNRQSNDIRSLRYALACALAEAVGDNGLSRASEALAELEATLAEPGDDPPDWRIHLVTAQLLEADDPARALMRYLLVAVEEEGEFGAQATERAHALLEASHEPKLVESLPPELLDRVAGTARGRPSTPMTLLAATLLRRSGHDNDALVLLQLGCETSSPPDPAVLAQLAGTLLDLEREDAALALIEEQDRDARDTSLQLIRAQAHLVKGDFDVARELADLLEDTSAPPVSAVRALSMLGLGRLDEALECLSTLETPEAHLARAVVLLQRLDYPEARESAWSLLRARPNDPDALIVNAQTVLEALEARTEESDAAQVDAKGPPTRAGAEIDSGRQLLSELATELQMVGPRSWLWRAQAAARRNDGRFRFFCCELQFALGQEISAQEIDDVDRTRTTYLQDAALQEIKAKILDPSDRAGAAEAYDEACRIFRDHTVDWQRAAFCARSAYELAATAMRASEYADRAVAESYEEEVDPTASLERLRDARTFAESWLRKADARDDLRLVHVLAWVGLRANELERAVELEVDRRSLGKAEVLRRLFAGLAAQPDDFVLRASGSWAAGAHDLKATAALLMQDILADAGGEGYVVETALAATANYYCDLARARPLLEEHAALNGDESWRNGVELYICVRGEDRQAIEQRRKLRIVDDAWGKQERAIASALLEGIPAAEKELADALEAWLQEKPPDRLAAHFIALVLGRRADADGYLAAAEDDPNERERDVEASRLAGHYVFDADMTEEEYLLQSLEFTDSPADIGWLVNVELPLLSAARAGSADPGARIGVGQDVVATRLRSLEDVEACARSELNDLHQGLPALARLADKRTGPGALVTAARDAQDAWPEVIPVPIRERIASTAIRRASGELSRRLLEARLDRVSAVNETDVALVVSGSLDVPVSGQLAVALLAPALTEDALGQAGLDATDDEVGAAAEEIARILRDVLANDAATADAVEEYWKLDAVLEDVEGAPTVSVPLRKAASRARTACMSVLDETLKLTRDSAKPDIPMVTPIVVEVADDLVPFVDSSQDGGVFLYELIPAMRERITASMGVSVPGVRMRGNPSLPDGGFQVQVDETPVLTSTVVIGPKCAIVPADEDALDQGGEVTDFHPLTGESGLWVLRTMAEDTGDGADELTTAQVLIHHIETVLRDQLPHFLGPQEADALIDTWIAQDDEGLVASVLPDADARLRLTWLLQALLADGVPTTEWRALLSVVRDEGGAGVPTRALHRAARRRLHDQLPGRRTGRKRVPVPDELERALLDEASATAQNGQPRHEFLRWLRRTIAADGSALALVTTTDDSRELVSALGRAEHRLITTVTEDELAA